MDHFLARYAKQFRKRLVALAPESMERLLRYGWPGNIRELQNVIERACIIAHSPIVEVHDPLRDAAAPTRPAATLEQVEREHILRVLSGTEGRIEGPRGAATILGLHLNTLRSRMHRLGIHLHHRDAWELHGIRGTQNHHKIDINFLRFLPQLKPNETGP